jgi:hypothetical protein
MRGSFLKWLEISRKTKERTQNQSWPTQNKSMVKKRKSQKKNREYENIQNNHQKLIWNLQSKTQKA